MKAIFAHGARDLRLGDCELSTPGKGEVTIAIRRGGICGSDLHYYLHGGFGAVKLREPMILGHEVAGEVTDIGEGVTGLAEGDLVALSPSRPCRSCVECLRGLPNQCLNMRFYGSAMPFPHIQGAFRQHINADASQCVKAGGLSAAQAAMAEPLSVCLHGVGRAGPVLGKRVLVTGCGPIGVLAILAARRAGAEEIVAVDIAPPALEYATRAGADTAIDSSSNPDALASYQQGKGYFDIMLECSGAAPALTAGIAAMRPRGIIVQLGVGGEMPLPMTAITAKELDLRGSFRFHDEFMTAVRLMQAGLIDVEPLLTHNFPFTEFVEAFDTAADRSKAMKVQLDFAP